MSAINARRMLSKADIKLVKSLSEKSFRYANKLFVAEGSKSVTDLLGSKLKVERIFALKDWIDKQKLPFVRGLNITEVSTKDIEQMSSLKSTREVIALFAIPQFLPEPKNWKGLVLALDTIQDPGNLGTLIRLADWYGIENIICSLNTVDCFNNKVVQATMGSIGRVNIFYGELSDWFRQAKMPVIAASMEGKPAREFDFPENMILLIGNEGAGISAGLNKEITSIIAIERRGNAESLNAAIAGAILIDRYFGK